MTKKIILQIMLIAAFLSSRSFGADQFCGVRNCGMAGSGLAMAPSTEAMYLNPAGLAFVEQSILAQSFSAPAPGRFRLSQNILIHLAGFPCVGGAIDLRWDKDSRKLQTDTAWFFSLKILKYFAFGVSSDAFSGEKELHAGGILSFPVKSIVSRFGIGLLYRGFDYSAFAIKGPMAGLSRDTSVGVHLGLGGTKSLTENLTLDTHLVEDGHGLPFGRGTTQLGFEQIFSQGRVSLSFRLGTVVRPGVKPEYTAGAGVRIDFLEFELSARPTGRYPEYRCSVSYRLSSKTSAVSSNSVKRDPFPVYEEMPFSFNGMDDPGTSHFLFKVETRENYRINYWHLCLIGENHEIVKSLDALGKPPSVIIIEYKDLPAGKYCAELTLVIGNGDRTASHSIDLVRSPEGLVLAANADDRASAKGEPQ